MRNKVDCANMKYGTYSKPLSPTFEHDRKPRALHRDAAAVPIVLTPEWARAYKFANGLARRD